MSAVAMATGGVTIALAGHAVAHQETLMDDASTARDRAASLQISRFGRSLEIPQEHTLTAKPEVQKVTLSTEQQKLIDSYRISEGQKKFLGEMVEAMMNIGPGKTNRLGKLGQIWQEMGMEPNGELETTHHNILGIKFWGNPGDISTGPIRTSEWRNGVKRIEYWPFVHFDSYEACIERGIGDMERLKHYRGTMAYYDRPDDTYEQSIERARLFIHELQHPTGHPNMAYATDPNYEHSTMYLITNFIGPVLWLEPWHGTQNGPVVE